MVDVIRLRKSVAKTELKATSWRAAVTRSEEAEDNRINEIEI